MLFYNRQLRKLSYHVHELEANKKSETISLIFFKKLLINNINVFPFKRRSIKHCEN